MYPTNPPPLNRIRLDYIDALRGIAALMVLICHCTQVDTSIQLAAPVMHLFESLKYGVQLFFVISAFTIFYSLYSSDCRTYNFFVRRFLRIAPLYFVAVAGYGLLYNANAQGLFLNLTFLHGFSPTYINSVVPGGWSIGVEMAFYCAVPFLFRRITTTKAALNFLLVALIASFILLYVYRKFLPSTGEWESFIYFWLPNQLTAFAIGIVIYFLTFQAESTSPQAAFFPLASLALLVLFALMTNFALFGEHVVFAAACGLFIYLLKFRSFPGLVNPVTLFLGKISYSLYLSQYAALNLLQKTGLYSLLPGKEGGAGYLNTAANLLLLFVTSVGISYMTYRLIESPFQEFGKKLLKAKIRYNGPEAQLRKGEVRTLRQKEGNTI